MYDEEGIAHPLPESMLPLELPEVDDYSPRTFDPPDDADTQPETPPLSRNAEWVNVTLDLGDGAGPRNYRRETNTMPNWAGSCWYELRYLDPNNSEKLVDPAIEEYWMARARDSRPAASTCTWAAPSTPCCTCCTPVSGRRCCTTWATSPPPSRSTSCTTRA